MNKGELINELEKRNIPCSEHQIDQMLFFMDYILEWNEKINLTAIKDGDAFVEKMIFDSAIALTDLDINDKIVIDVGTGAGFPGVILYLLNPKADITLLDSTSKKIQLLDNFAKEHNLTYKCVSERAEEYAKKNREKYDYVFSRAVAPLNILLEITVPLLKVGGYLIALKGPGLEEELNSSTNALKKIGCHVKKVIADELPDSLEARNIIYIEKDKPTNNKYPRDYKDIKKIPL